MITNHVNGQKATLVALYRVPVVKDCLINITRQPHYASDILLTVLGITYTVIRGNIPKDPDSDSVSEDPLWR